MYRRDKEYRWYKLKKKLIRKEDKFSRYFHHHIWTFIIICYVTQFVSTNLICYTSFFFKFILLYHYEKCINSFV